MREERPEQEDLTIPDNDRTLWQMRQHRSDSAEAWKAWVREQSPRRVYQLDRGVVRLPATSMPGVPRDRLEDNQGVEAEEEGGDS